ncbi:Hypothetical predicted protein, partial [Pelobates cultripes]
LHNPTGQVGNEPAMGSRTQKQMAGAAADTKDIESMLQRPPQVKKATETHHDTSPSPRELSTPTSQPPEPATQASLDLPGG